MSGPTSRTWNRSAAGATPRPGARSSATSPPTPPTRARAAACRAGCSPLAAGASEWSGLVGVDLARDATTRQTFVWDEGLWAWPEGYAKPDAPKYEVVVLDYGVKRNILRALSSIGARATVVPADTSAEDILARKPDGILLSNGPGAPAAPGEYAVPHIPNLL